MAFHGVAVRQTNHVALQHAIAAAADSAAVMGWEFVSMQWVPLPEPDHSGAAPALGEMIMLFRDAALPTAAPWPPVIGRRADLGSSARDP